MKKIDVPEVDRQKYLTILETVVTETEYSAYGISTVLNVLLERDGKEPIRSQMMYNYGRNGLIVSGEKIFGQTLRNYSKEEVTEFLIRYCVRNGVTIKDSKESNPNQLELDLEI